MTSLQGLGGRFLVWCQPPHPVVDKPATVRYEVRLAGGVEFAGEFARDAAGNSRIELRDSRSETPLFAQLTPGSANEDILIMYPERSVAVRKFPPSPPLDAWSFGPFRPEWTDQHVKFADHDLRKVILTIATEEGAQETGECWVSELLTAVFHERIVALDGGVHEWRAIHAEAKVAAGDLLAVPADFRMLPESSPL